MGMTFEVTAKGRTFYVTIEEIYQDRDTWEIIDIDFEVYNKGFKPVTRSFGAKQLKKIEHQIRQELQDNMV